MKTNLKFVYLALFMIAIVAGCKKAEEAEDYTEAIQTTEDLARENEKEDNNWMYIEGEYVQEDYIQKPAALSSGLLPSCASVTWSNNNTVLSISFGDASSGCSTGDGTVLQGILEATTSGVPVTQGSVIEVSEQGFPGTGGFKVGERIVDGNSTATYRGHGEWDIHREFTVTYPDGKQFSFSGNFHLEKIQGQGTATMDDDVYKITGSGSGTNRYGHAYTFEITDPLVKEVSCPYISEGKFEVVVGSVTVELDFAPDGVNACDKRVRLNVNNGKLIQDIEL